MENIINPNESRRNKGQTLAEFSLTLPVLLILLFGIIEFGRLFQSWVTIQNAARAAARYTVTGQYDETRYPLTLIPCDTNRVALSKTTYLAPIFTPADFNLTNYQSQVGGVTAFNDRYVYTANQLYRKVDIWQNNGVANNEYLYRTWYGTPDCDAADADSLQDRKDMLRLPSIYDVARIGAAGLSLEPSISNQRSGETLEQALERFLYTAYSNPNTSIDTPGWFNVVVCSARGRQFSTALGDILNNTDDPASGTTNATFRYDTVESPNDSAQYADLTAGACINKETLKTPSSEYLNHFELPMLDAGGAGERVTIIITYNHPLITPLGLARYVRLQSIRSAVNESFKVTNAERALGPSVPSGPGFVTPTPAPPTETPTKTFTPLPSLTPSKTATATPTETETPFSCTKIQATPIAFVDNRVYVRFTNTNYEDTYIQASTMYWDSAKLSFDFPNASVQYLTFNNELIWQGVDKVSPVDTRIAGVYPAGDNGNGISYITTDTRLWLYGTNYNSPDVVWEATFVNGPQLLSSYFGGWEFAGTEFRFYNFANPAQPCVVPLQVPNAPPTKTPAPLNFTPSPTFTPNCASSLLKVQFVRFDPDGDVVLQVVNNRTVEAPFRGFSLTWPAYKVPSLKYVKMVVGGVNGNNSDGTGTVVWNALSGGGYRPASVVVGNPTPPTVTTHSDTSAGVWNDNNDPYDVAYTFRPSSTTLVFIDFTGVGTSTLDTRGITPSDFNGTRLIIECGRGNRNPNGTCSTSPCNGGPWSGGGGGGGSGDIILDNNPTPPPTSPPVPTNTPGPTPTPSKTKTPSPPTKTFTPAPPTSTAKPTNTKAATNTPTPTPTEGSGDLGGND